MSYEGGSIVTAVAVVVLSWPCWWLFREERGSWVQCGPAKAVILWFEIVVARRAGGCVQSERLAREGVMCNVFEEYLHTLIWHWV